MKKTGSLDHRLSAMTWICLSLGAAALLSASEPEGNGTALPPKLQNAAANTWVKLAEEKTGSRNYPMFIYHPKLGKYLLSAGQRSNRWDKKNDHYDTELFDPATCKWSNLFPKGLSYKPASGPVKAPGVGLRERDAGKVDKDGVYRIAREGNAWGRDANTYFQWALCPEDGKLYSYYQNRTLAFDPETGRWSDLNVPEICPKFPSFQWNTTLGAMAWDPVNKELLWFGGTADVNGGSPGTRALKPGEKKWRRVPVDAPALKKLRAQARRFERQAAALVNAWRNRFHRVETEAEAKADFASRGGESIKACEGLIAAIKSADVNGARKNAIGAAEASFLKVLDGLRKLAALKDDRERLLKGQTLVDLAECAGRALDSEPCGRGVSPMAVDRKRGKIVLFGGCRFDSYLADTWVYDCKTRTWEQRWPKVSPAPRCGHLLGWLPRSGKVVLYGAGIYGEGSYRVPHGNPRPPQDLWTYDIEKNEWNLLAQKGKPPVNGTAAVGPNDELIFLPRNRKGARVTWAMKVDPDAAAAGPARAGVAPGSVTHCFNGPDHFDRDAKIEPGKIEALLKGLPTNTWTMLPKQSKNCNGHEWGSSSYDAKRHQIIFWGGGHSSWHYNDASHYSLRTATWSIGYREEYPFPSAGFKAMFNQSFNNRPFIGSHIWDAAAYDAVSDRVVVCARGGAWMYDPVARHWDYPRKPSAGEMRVNMAETPRGAVMWHGNRLFIFSGKKGVFRPLPMTGDKLGATAYCDEAGICHDASRDALWLARKGSPMYRYDFEGGKVTRINCPPPAGVFMRESVHVPEIDMLLNVVRTKGKDGQVGNLAFDIAAGKWIGLELAWDKRSKWHQAKGSPYVSTGMHYDPLFKVVVFHNNNKEVLVARLARAGLKTFEVKIAAPKKKR